MLNSSIIRPGLMVRLATKIEGNVTYSKEDIAHYESGGSDVAEWRTQRIIRDAEELEAAKVARGKASTLVRGVCVKSEFMGLLCPVANKDKLAEAITGAREVVAAFNAVSRLTRVRVYVATGEMQNDEIEAARAIKAEMAGLIDAMAEGVKTMNPEAIRDAANKARDVGRMLSEDVAKNVKTAIETARKVAREIIKAGDVAAQEVDTLVLRKITEQRTAFLDLDDAKPMAPVVEAPRAVDFAPETAADEGLVYKADATLAYAQRVLEL